MSAGVESGTASDSSTISSNTSLVTGSISSLLSHSHDPDDSLSRTLSSLTTPVPDSNPLDGGILVEEPYNTEAYNLPSLPAQRRFVDMTYRASLPNLQPVDENIDNILAHEFNTQKVAAKGTLQRMKTKVRPDIQSHLGVDTSSDDTDIDQTDTEKLLSTLTESFDMKMRLLLDPHYQSSGNISGANQNAKLFSDTFNLEDVNLSGTEKKKIDEAKNVLQQVKAGRKVDLKRA